MINYSITENNNVSSLKIALENNSKVLVQQGAIEAIKGNIDYIPVHNLKRSWNARAHGRKIIKDLFQGSGEIYIKSTLDKLHRLVVGGELIINPLCFIACDGELDINPFSRNFVEKFFNGVQIIEPQITGNGTVIVKSLGDLHCFELKNNEYISKRPVIARERDVYAMRRTIAGEKYYTYKGHGKIYASIGNNEYSLV